MNRYLAPRIILMIAMFGLAGWKCLTEWETSRENGAWDGEAAPNDRTRQRTRPSPRRMEGNPSLEVVAS